MKLNQIVFKALIGLGASVIVMIIAYIIIHLFKIETESINFFVGWVSCMGFYTAVEIYKINNPPKTNI